MRGHLARVCSSALKGKPKASKQPVRAITEPVEEPESSWVNCLTLNISHAHGSLNFPTFPDTGSAATLIAADLARKHNIKITAPSLTKYINVSGDPVPTLGSLRQPRILKPLYENKSGGY